MSVPVFLKVMLVSFATPARTTPKSIVSGILNPGIVVVMSGGVCGEEQPINKTIGMRRIVIFTKLTYLEKHWGV